MIKRALYDCGKENWYIPNKGKLKISYGYFTGNKKEAVFIIKFPDKRSIALLYRINGEEYAYSTLIDTFSEIIDYQIINCKNGDLLIVRETIDQLVGAFEKGTYIRAYRYNRDIKQFSLVLSIIEAYKAYWNEMWDKNKTCDNNWLKAEEKAGIKWFNGDTLKVEVLRRQSIAKTNARVDMPNDSEFEVIASRDVAEEYIWSEKWNHFILFEAILNKTQEHVAVIENLSSSPFELFEEQGEKNYKSMGMSKLRIKKENNAIEIVPAQAVSR